MVTSFESETRFFLRILPENSEPAIDLIVIPIGHAMLSYKCTTGFLDCTKVESKASLRYVMARLEPEETRARGK